MQIDLAAVDRVYSDKAGSRYFKHRVGHDGLKAFCSGLGLLERQLGSLGVRDDPYWTDLMRTAKRLRFDALAAPLPFSQLRLPIQIGELRKRYARSATLFPQVADLVNNVLDTLEAVNANGASPLADAAASRLPTNSPDAIALVLCDARLVTSVTLSLREIPRFDGIVVLGQRELRSTVWFDQLFFFGAPYWYDDYVFTAPRARTIGLFRYAWLGGSLPVSSLFTTSLTQKASPVRDPDDDASPDALSMERVEAPSWIADISHFDQRSNQSHQDEEDAGKETTVVRPFLLEGDKVAFLEADGTGSALVIDLDEFGEDRLQRVSIDDIDEGMFLLLRSGGGGDYVVPVADSLLGSKAEKLRDLQAEWKGRLRQAVRESGLFEVSVQLLDLGSRKANEQNVRHWMHERSIRTGDQADFSSIMVLVGLGDRKNEFWEAMKTIDMAHLQAGQRIRKALLNQVGRADLTLLERAGSMEFDLPGEDTGSMIASRVLDVGRETLEIAAHRVGRPLPRQGV